ncbi:MAG: response regulator [Candidatus Acidiferrales bacterium]
MEILSNRDSSESLGGGRAARILVADDNSNIQRMVALALKDHGIDVVAVGNGEAAVRSMGQVTPDLILADVFMPVRSGYEVCEFVKKDSRYSHIPVVLLLGAFDPLDENEAKRVGADGVLKKPFVPPDPMIALVKALLEKSAPERAVPVPVAVAAGPEAHAVPEQPVFRPARPVAPLPPIDESPEIDYPPMGRDAFDSAAPVAMASSEPLAAAATQVEDESEVVTRQRDTALGEPAFWRPVEPETSTEQTQAEVRAGGHGFEPAEPGAGYFEAPADDAEVSTPVAQPESAAQTESAVQADGESRVEQGEVAAQSWAEPVAAAESETNAPEVHSPEAQVSEESKPEWSASPNDWLIPAIPPVTTDAVISDANGTEVATDWPPAPQAPMIELGAPGERSFAPSSAVWNEPDAMSAAIESAAPCSTEESHVGEQAVEPEHEQAPATESKPLAWEAPTPTPLESVQPALADTQKIAPEILASVREPQREALGSELPATEPAETVVPDTASAGGESAAARPTTDELVNAVVARVIQKLQPQIADMINEEILRPVVSALVRREIETQ